MHLSSTKQVVLHLNIFVKNLGYKVLHFLRSLDKFRVVSKSSVKDTRQVAAVDMNSNAGIAEMMFGDYVSARKSVLSP